MNITEFLKRNGGYYRADEIAAGVGMADGYVQDRIDELELQGKIERRTYGGKRQYRIARGEGPPSTDERREQRAKAKVVEAIQHLAAELGRTPTYDEYKQHARRNELPSSTVVSDLFGIWSNAVREAGLEVRSPGRQPGTKFAKRAAA